MFIIRADGNAKIGAGHLMRCLTIGAAVRRLNGEAHRSCGEEIVFFCADEDSAGLVESRGFRAEVLHTDYRRMDGELAAWDARVEGTRNIILVDSYYVTAAYLGGIGKFGAVYLMDDMQREAYPVNGVINYNLFANPQVYRRLYGGASGSSRDTAYRDGRTVYDRDVRCFLGGEYVPLREQFRNVEYHVGDSVKDVLITTGGGDADNIAGAVLDELYRENITYHVLIGRFSPHFESWQRRAEETRNIRMYFDVQNMAALMRRCDLAVSAGGSTLYELMAVGVPFICFSYAENQEALTEYMGNTRTAGYAGAWHKDGSGTRERMKQLFDLMCEDGALRKQYSDRGRSLIDGQGADRLARALCGE